MYSKRHEKRLIKAEKEKILNTYTENDIDMSSDINIINDNLHDNSDSDYNFETDNFSESGIKNSLQCEDLNESSLIADLTKWSTQNNITRSAFNSLLHVLRKWQIDVPASAESLIKRQRCVVRTFSPGSYLHLGVKNQLIKISDVIKNMDIIVLDIGNDGLPLYKSSQISLWPILGKIVPQLNTDVLLFGVYLGKKKPNNPDSYLHDFASEMSDLLANGLNINGKFLKIQIRAFICDTPAKAFMCQTVGHNSLEGCGRCIQKGKTIKKTTVYSTSKASPRTDEDFSNRFCQSFHKNSVSDRMILENLGIQMVSQFPLDAMHLVDLGVVK